jgi:hypothetical protein
MEFEWAPMPSDKASAPAGARGALQTAKLFEPCGSFEHAAQVVTELLRQYVGVRRWYALRRRGAGWSAVDTRDLALLEERDAALFADAMVTALSEATGPLLIAQLRGFAPVSVEAADYSGGAYLIGVPLLQRRRLDGFVCGLSATVPYAEIRQHRTLIQASVRLLNTLLEYDAQRHTLRRWAERGRVRTAPQHAGAQS